MKIARRLRDVSEASSLCPPGRSKARRFALQFGHLREFTTFPDRQCTTSGRSGLNHGWVELPYLSTEAADYVKAVVEPQRIGKYPQITQITQILFQILCAPSWDRIKRLRSKLFAPKLIKRPLSWPLALR